MKTYYRTVILPIHIEEDGQVFDVPKGRRVLTSELREESGVAVVTVLSSFWVTVPFDHFGGSEPAYGHKTFGEMLESAKT